MRYPRQLGLTFPDETRSVSVEVLLSAAMFTLESRTPPKSRASVPPALLVP